MRGGFVLVGLLLVSGCGSTNQMACEAYVQEVNGVYSDCGFSPPYDVETSCPASLNEGGDCTALYECLAEGYTCTDDGVLYDVEGCSCAG